MRLLAVIGALAILIGVGAAVYFFLGLYSVAAMDPHQPIVNWALERVRVASIERHATDRPPSGFDQPANVQAGAKAFGARGCPTCHGAPGVEWAKFSEGIRPDPPDLTEVGPALKPEEIFWVVKNGIKMTGMPGFGLIGVDDAEIWRITAFVKALPKVSEADYKQWTGEAPQQPEPK